MKKLFAILLVLLTINLVISSEVTAKHQQNGIKISNLHKEVDSIESRLRNLLKVQEQLITTQSAISQNIVELREDYRDLKDDYQNSTNWTLGIVTLIVAALGIGAPYLLNRQANKKQEQLVDKMEKAVVQVSEVQSCVDNIKDTIEKSEKRAAESRKQSLINSWFSQASNEKDDHEAIRIYSRIIQIDPKNFRAYVNRATIYINNEDSPELAKRDLDIAASLQPNNYIVYMVRGRANSLLQNYIEAINDANVSVSLAPQLPNVYEQRASTYMEFSKWREAIRDYDKIAKLSKLDSNGYNNRAYAYMRIKKLDLALADINDAIRLDGDNAAAYDTRGSIYYHKGAKYYEESLRDFTKAILLNPRLWVAYENRANLYKSMISRCSDAEQKQEYIKLKGIDLYIFRKKDSYFTEHSEENINENQVTTI